MKVDVVPEFERPALDLALRDWLVVALIVTLILGAAMHVPFRDRAPAVERDYRIPYALSTRYELYRRYTGLAASQYPTLLVGDSVVWGQCAFKNDTLSHHLNELVKQPRFANAGLDGMRPVALAQLLEYHAPALENTRILLQFDPLWLMLEGPGAPHQKAILYNRPDLIPRLAAHLTGPFRRSLAVAWSTLTQRPPIRDWIERFADSRLDFLAWSLDHPYESPFRAITSALPPSEDRQTLRVSPWNRSPGDPVDSPWGDLSTDVEWQSFLGILDLLKARGNEVLVVLGPMNEHMMSAHTLQEYRRLRERMEMALRAAGVRTFVPSVLRSEHYGDICHPLGAGYEELARELLQKESAWLLGLDQRR